MGDAGGGGYPGGGTRSVQGARCRLEDAGSALTRPSFLPVEGVVYSLLFNGDDLCHSVRKSGYEDGSSWDGCKTANPDRLNPSPTVPPLDG